MLTDCAPAQPGECTSFLFTHVSITFSYLAGSHNLWTNLTRWVFQIPTIHSICIFPDLPVVTPLVHQPSQVRAPDPIYSHLPHTSEGIFWVLQPSYQPRLTSFPEPQCIIPTLPGIAGLKQVFHQHADIDLSHINTLFDNHWIRIPLTLPSIINISVWRDDLPIYWPSNSSTWSKTNQAWTKAKTEIKFYSTEQATISDTMKEVWMPIFYHKHTNIKKGQNNPITPKLTNSIQMFFSKYYLD